jgi:neutral ceramidase
MNRNMHRSKWFFLLFFISSTAHALQPANYLVGRGSADITGPAYGLQMWGFGREDQLTEGIHSRLRARAFIIAEPEGQEDRKDQRLVFVSADIGSIEHNMTLEIVDRLKERYGDRYSLDNVIISATHTHAGPGGYWHTRTEFALMGAFYPSHYNRIVSGIFESIVAAHDDLQPGNIRLNKGRVEAAGVNRSAIAYLQNPAEERAAFADDTDKEMTLLKFTDDSGDIGMINWFAVHPTSMTYYNKLISGDHKGYASQVFERERGATYDSSDDFIAAFAQTNAGDVTPNLNLDNTGPGIDDFDSTRIIGSRQLEVAEALFDYANEHLEGKVDYRQIYVNLAELEVDDQFTGSGSKTTCPSAYGYSFAGGSTEDGGGHFLFDEGMTSQNFILDFLIRFLTGAPAWTPEVKRCQTPKPILFESGTGDPPVQSQIRSVTIARIGQLVILALPAEVTTMAGRRLRKTVLSNLGDWAKHIVIAGYSNGYAGYITTPEEYEIQQYEGGHTLHGKWTLPAYQQISARLAVVLNNSGHVEGSVAFDDWRGKSKGEPLPGNVTATQRGNAVPGEALPLQQLNYAPGDLITAEFSSVNPTASFSKDGNYLKIQRKVQQKKQQTWVTIAIDSDWSTKIQWRHDDRKNQYFAKIDWRTHVHTPAGEYRIQHIGHYTTADGHDHEFEGTSQIVILGSE